MTTQYEGGIILSAPDEGVAGGQFGGEVRLQPSLRQPGAVVKLRLSFETEGKGDEDTGSFEYVISRDRTPPDPLPFAIVLPREPWSYSGRILKIIWTITVVAELDDDSSYRIQRGLKIRSPFRQ